MGKKMMKLPSLFKNREPTSSSSWQWPSCTHSKTHSFRGGDDIFKTVNSVYFDAATGGEIVNTPESWFTNSSESGSFSTVSEESGEESLEMVIRGLRSERLFFEPGHTNSILEEAKSAGGVRFKESVVMAMDSEDPYVDFRNSMEEMVEAHGLKDWECLEELLSWYLRVNGKKNHGYIVGAFVDLLVGLAASSAAAHQASNSSSSSPSLSSILQDPEEDIEKVSCLEISEI